MAQTLKLLLVVNITICLLCEYHILWAVCKSNYQSGLSSVHDLKNQSRNVRKGEKYFIFSTLMGRLNNQLITFISSAYWGKTLRRTLVFPGWSEQEIKDGRIRGFATVPFEKYFDLNYFCANYGSIMSRDDYESHILPQLKSEDFKFRMDLPNIYFNKNFTRTYLLEQLTSENAIHLQVGVTYRWNLPTDEYQKLMSFFRPRKEILEVAHSFMNRVLSKPYAAIHLRRWEGACKMPSSEILTIIEQHLKMKNFRSVFLASDGQDPILQEYILKKYNASIFNQDLGYLGVYANGIADGYILSYSNLYFANRHSNLSKNWYRYRLGICRAEWRKNMCGKAEKNKLLCEEFHRTEDLCIQDFQVVIMSPKNSSSLCR